MPRPSRSNSRRHCARTSRRFFAPEPAGPLLQQFLGTLSRGPMNTVNFLVALNQQLQQRVNYVIRMEPGVQTPDETLQIGSGSCRDSAWLLVQILRHLGMPARFVSGYLIQLKPDIKPLDGPAGAAADFTDLHAWTEVYIPGAGWIGLDPTSGLLCGEGHLPVAATPHYHSAAPLTGFADGAAEDFSFEMQVTRIAERPRVTLPFSDDAWAALDALGQKVDADLVAQDVRLTMGGEPTFVSIDDYQSAEWNTDALGPTKRIRADELIRRLRRRFAPGGLLHYGQGKWYPGEPLPRWAFALYWRKDGHPIWRDDNLIAREGPDLAPSPDAARQFGEGIAARLGIAPDHVMPAFEDPVQRMIEEGAWPANVDPADPRIDDPAERAQLMRAFERRVTAPTGYVLPVQPANAPAHPSWLSEVWELRRGRLFLIPGDSPVGFRLPLNSLPYLAPIDRPHTGPVDPFAPRGELPHPEVLFQRAHQRLAGTIARTGNTSEAAPAPRNTGNGGAPVRTALTVEPRDGHFCVFMPPVERLEDYLELHRGDRGDRGRFRDPDPDRRLCAALRSAHQRDQGHARSRRDRGQRPSGRARGARRSTSPASSTRRRAHPARHRQVHDRRPPHRHRRRQPRRARRRDPGRQPVPAPAGPAQEPRALLAAPSVAVLSVLRPVHRPDQPGAAHRRGAPRHPLRAARSRSRRCRRRASRRRCPGWSTGCSATCWSTSPATPIAPRSASTSSIRRTGRPAGSAWSSSASFEMPPDARMSLAQQLLLRALIAWFWREPPTGRLVRWGTALHDRFMLPHFVWQDFLEVLDDLAPRRLPLRSALVRGPARVPLPALRRGRSRRRAARAAPRAGAVACAGRGERDRRHGALRRLLGRAAAGQASRASTPTATSSPATAAACRWPPPARPASPSPACASRRGRCRQRCTRPSPSTRRSPSTSSTAGAHRSLGGCVYHVAHPGGRNYETFPVNSYEAEARRRARFQEHGHTPGFVADIPVPEYSLEYPTTLDLRRKPGFR